MVIIALKWVILIWSILELLTVDFDSLSRSEAIGVLLYLCLIIFVMAHDLARESTNQEKKKKEEAK